MEPPLKNNPDPMSEENHLVEAQIQLELQQAVAFHQKGELTQAKEHYQHVLEIRPNHFSALHMLGVIAHQTNNFLQAIELINSAIEINPNDAVAYNNRGIALQELGQFVEAIASYDQAIKFDGNFVTAYYNRGNTLRDLKQWNEALTSYDCVINLQADHLGAHNNRGITLQELKRWDEALTSYEHAIKLDENLAAAYNNAGIVLHELKRCDEALIYFDRAIKLKADYADSYNNRGNVLSMLKRWGEARASFTQAIKCDIEFADAYSNLATTLQKMKLSAEAKSIYAKLLDIAPDFSYGEGGLLHAKMMCCDWGNLTELSKSIEINISLGKKSTSPFGYQAISNSEETLQACAKIIVADQFPSSDIKLVTNKRLRHRKIRIGFFSGEFRHQATSILMTELWELHNKDQFEIFAFDNGWDDKSELRSRIKSAFNEMIDISQMNDFDAAQIIYKKEIDILVNLNGYFGDPRLGIFAFRPSPIQVNYLGFPGTLGADYIDYLIVDNTVIPSDSRQFYSEKIAYLPDCYQANDRQRRISDKFFSRAEFGLPETGFVFCCFNNHYKITPATFDGWMRILKQVEGSVLWLLEGDSSAVENLRIEANKRGVNSQRLVFSPQLPLAEHLARHRLADLFLDTLPYNAHTTSSDALWAGLPILTCIGQTFPGRVAASLLNAIGLPELITTTQEQYEALAIELAINPARLNQIKQTLEQNRLTTPLFDTVSFTKNIEDAYAQMINRYQNDLPPEHIVVAS